MEHVWLVLGGLLAIAVAGFTLWRLTRSWTRFRQHPLLAEVRLQKLQPSSATRQRLQRAAELFAEGWNQLERAEDVESAKAALRYFGEAVELDEMCCGWKKRFEQKLAMVGDLFSLPGDNSAHRFHTCLAEAYTMLLLNAVMEVYGKPSESLLQDYRVVKSRLDEAVQLQPRNPAAYKLRGDWCQRFGGLAERGSVQRDFKTAIRLADEDPDASRLNLHGVDPAVQRNHILAYCHFQLAASLQQEKDFLVALAHYEAVLQHADADSAQLPDTHFNLAVLVVLTADPDQDDQAAVLSRASRHYQKGKQAARKLRTWCPAGDSVSEALAGALLARLVKSTPLPEKSKDE